MSRVTVPKQILFVALSVLLNAGFFSTTQASAKKTAEDAANSLLARAHKRNSVLRAMSYFSLNEKEKAYALLEETFANDEHDKGEAALILAYADNRFLKKHKRHFYAHYAHGNQDIASQPKELNSLLRIVADGYFEDSNLIAASAAYDRLSRSSDPEDVDYAQYKMGWVDINQKDPSSAFSRWFERLESGKSRTQGLRRILIQDLGRAWAESYPVSDDQTKKVLSLSMNDTERQAFFDGVIAGLKRYQNLNHLVEFRTQLQRTQFAKPVITRAVDMGVGLGEDPCSIVNWFEKGAVGSTAWVDPRDIGTEALLPRFNACFKHVKAKQSDAWKTSPMATKLSNLYGAIELQGMYRWPRAAFWYELGKHDASCLEFLTLAREAKLANSSVEAEQFKPEAAQSLFDACKTVVATNTKIHAPMAQFFEDYLSPVFFGIGEKAPFNKPAIEMLAVAPVKTLVLSNILQRPDVYRKSIFVPVIVESLTEAQRVESGESLLSQFAEKPLNTIGAQSQTSANAVWIEVLRSLVRTQIQTNNFTKALALLSEYAPVTAKTNFAADKTADVWMLLALSLPATAPVEERTKLEAIAALQLSQLARELSAKKANKDDSIKAVALAMKYDRLLPIWMNWFVLYPVLKTEPNLITEIYQRTFDVVLKREPAGVELMLASRRVSAKAFKDILEIVELAGVDTIKKTHLKRLQTLKLDFGKGIEPTFMKDLAHLNTIRLFGEKLDNSKLVFSAKLPKQIEGRVNQVKQQLEMVGKYVWSDRIWLRFARVLVAQNCESLVLRLQEVRSPKDLDAETLNVWKTQLGNIVQMVSGWKTELLADSGKDTVQSQINTPAGNVSKETLSN